MLPIYHSTPSHAFFNTHHKQKENQKSLDQADSSPHVALVLWSVITDLMIRLRRALGIDTVTGYHLAEKNYASFLYIFII
jgi:hypothetical protein